MDKMEPVSTAGEAPPVGKEWLKQSRNWAANAPLPIMLHLSRAAHLVNQKLEADTKISRSQIRVLFESLEPEGVSQSFLGKQHNVDPASITRTVQAMERDGLVTRQPDKRDNRYMRVFITEKGRALLETMPPRLLQFEQELLEGWSEQEIMQLHALLDKIEQRMQLDQHLTDYLKEREAR